jgi:hypothetical protein
MDVSGVAGPYRIFLEEFTIPNRWECSRVFRILGNMDAHESASHLPPKGAVRSPRLCGRPLHPFALRPES